MAAIINAMYSKIDSDRLHLIISIEICFESHYVSRCAIVKYTLAIILKVLRCIIFGESD